MFTRTSPSTGQGSPRVTGFYDKDSGSIMYVAVDEATKQAALIDIVLDFDPAHARTRTDSAQEVLDYVRDEGLTVAWILDTHPHADHRPHQRHDDPERDRGIVVVRQTIPTGLDVAVHRTADDEG